MSEKDVYAVIHQAAPPPPVEGISKPMKRGGYRDSGADIAFNLQQLGCQVVTPMRDPDPGLDVGWTFEDTLGGID